MKQANKQNISKRIELHPATSHWMQGDRYGVIIGIGNNREFVDNFTKEHYQYRPYRVKLDKSEHIIQVHADNLTIL